MKHYFVAKTEKQVGEMVMEFLFVYQISKVIKIDDMGQQGEEEDYCYKVCIEFEDYYGEFDPRSNGMVHYHNEAEDRIKEACAKYLKKHPLTFYDMVSRPENSTSMLANKNITSIRRYEFGKEDEKNGNQ